MLAAVYKKFAGFQRDEEYIVASECATQEMSDDADSLRLGAGYLVKLPGFSDNATNALQKLLTKDPSVGQYMNYCCRRS